MVSKFLLRVVVVYPGKKCPEWNVWEENILFPVKCCWTKKHVWQAPLYLADDCVSDITRRSLRSADVPTCVVPRTLSSYGAAAGPRLWNTLPVQLRNPDIIYGLFRRQLKGHLFSEP